jgi:hypothetical protein
MNKQMQSILDELYALDPELKTRETELLPILEKLLKSKPDAQPDDAFVQRLRTMLRDEAASHKLNASNSHFSFFNFLRMNPFPYAITGAVLGAVITGPLVYNIVQNGNQLPPSDGSALFSYSIEETSDEAFGDLSNAQIQAGGRGGGGMGGAPEIDATTNAVRGQAMGSADVPVGTDIDQKMIIAPETTDYTFTIDGEMPALTQQQVEILKRQRGMNSPALRSILGSFNTGLIDLASFNDAKVDSINFYQDKPYGYSFYVNFRDGSLSLNSNWEHWPNPTLNCRDEACYERNRLKMNDIPADDVLINIAEGFVKDHKIDVAQYGPAEVDNTWRQHYETTPDKAQFYVPETARVVYPQLVNGQPVYDEGGAKAGISVNVNIREKRVSDVWGLMDQRLLASSYDAVTDSAQITDYLNKFSDMQGWAPEGENVKVTQVNITLGAPTMGYTKTYVYDEDKGTGDELIVPALIFPVKNVPAGQYFYRTSIAVPLAKDLLEKMNQNYPMPMPRPMPLIMEDAPADDAAGE